MHGIPTWGYLYHAVIPLLVQAGYRVIAPDFLGHGWSDRRDRFDRSFQDQARMIISLLDALHLDCVDVVGVYPVYSDEAETAHLKTSGMSYTH